MTTTTPTLPAGLDALASQLSAWALPTQNERQSKRIGSTREELKAFYDAVLPKLQDILGHADEFPLGQMPPETQHLFNIALSLAEVAPHIELYRGNPKVPFSFDEARFIADSGAVAG